MIDIMNATTTNSTSVHFEADHMCKKHQTLFNLEHIKKFEHLSRCHDVRKYANMLKDQHILDWDKEDRQRSIAVFIYLTAQMQNLL